MSDELKALRQQRDELLAACEWLEDELRERGYPANDPMRERIRSAIARVTKARGDEMLDEVARRQGRDPRRARVEREVLARELENKEGDK